MSRCGFCPHQTDEHTARGGCMHRKERGIICGCGWTSGRAHGANPFTTVATATTTTKGK